MKQYKTEYVKYLIYSSSSNSINKIINNKKYNSLAYITNIASIWAVPTHHTQHGLTVCCWKTTSNNNKLLQ